MLVGGKEGERSCGGEGKVEGGEDSCQGLHDFILDFFLVQNRDDWKNRI